MELDDLLDEMTCPQCGEYDEYVEDSVFFEGKACAGCDAAEQQRHIQRGCTDPGCNCQYAQPPTDIEDL